LPSQGQRFLLGHCHTGFPPPIGLVLFLANSHNFGFRPPENSRRSPIGRLPHRPRLSTVPNLPSTFFSLPLFSMKDSPLPFNGKKRNSSSLLSPRIPPPLSTSLAALLQRTTLSFIRATPGTLKNFFFFPPGTSAPYPGPKPHLSLPPNVLEL